MLAFRRFRSSSLSSCSCSWATIHRVMPDRYRRPDCYMIRTMRVTGQRSHVTKTTHVTPQYLQRPSQVTKTTHVTLLYLQRPSHVTKTTHVTPQYLQRPSHVTKTTRSTFFPNQVTPVSHPTVAIRLTATYWCHHVVTIRGSSVTRTTIWRCVAPFVLGARNICHYTQLLSAIKAAPKTGANSWSAWTIIIFCLGPTKDE